MCQATCALPNGYGSGAAGNKLCTACSPNIIMQTNQTCVTTCYSPMTLINKTTYNLCVQTYTFQLYAVSAQSTDTNTTIQLSTGTNGTNYSYSNGCVQTHNNYAGDWGVIITCSVYENATTNPNISYYL
jgi:hypothetical protein